LEPFARDSPLDATVIEAKRSGRLQPATKGPATKGNEVMSVALSGPVVKPLLPGIRQAMDYAMENGVAIAAVSSPSRGLILQAVTKIRRYLSP
jgi:hypothetical protein